jgi:hypothetical protein
LGKKLKLLQGRFYAQRIDLFKVGFSFCFDAPVPVFGTGVFFGAPLP